MNEVIAALWKMSWWQLAWIYLVIQWIVLVQFWPFYLAVAVVRALIWWRWKR